MMNLIDVMLRANSKAQKNKNYMILFIEIQKRQK